MSEVDNKHSLVRGFATLRRHADAFVVRSSGTYVDRCDASAAALTRQYVLDVWARRAKKGAARTPGERAEARFGPKRVCDASGHVFLRYGCPESNKRHPNDADQVDSGPSNGAHVAAQVPLLE